MAQKYRIYINEKAILITDSLPKNLQKYVKIEADVLDFKIIFTWVLANQCDYFYVLHNNPKKVLKSAIKSVALIKAAGGVVENENNEILFIFRNGKWDLPKGKVEKKEKVKRHNTQANKNRHTGTNTFAHTRSHSLSLVRSVPRRQLADRVPDGDPRPLGGTSRGLQNRCDRLGPSIPYPVSQPNPRLPTG